SPARALGIDMANRAPAAARATADPNICFFMRSPLSLASSSRIAAAGSGLAMRRREHSITAARGSAAAREDRLEPLVELGPGHDEAEHEIGLLGEIEEVTGMDQHAVL